VVAGVAKLFKDVGKRRGAQPSEEREMRNIATDAVKPSLLCRLILMISNVD
jgi:hypothetical protein